MIHLDESARLECRGVEGDQNTIRGLLTGFEPIWLPDQNVDGRHITRSIQPAHRILLGSWMIHHAQFDWTI